MVEKVLGTLPDLGEEIALMHLNGLCESIAEIYEHGAEIVIASDGLVLMVMPNDFNSKKQETDWAQISLVSVTPMYGIIPQLSEISLRPKSYATSALFALLIFFATREQES